MIYFIILYSFNYFQSEQKRFLQQHKQRSETYSKAAATMKKQRKKNKGTTKTGLAMDKELKVGDFLFFIIIHNIQGVRETSVIFLTVVGNG